MTPLFGIYSGIVVSTQDPQNRGRVKLRVPQVMGAAITGWAEPVVIGNATVGDQVFAAFEGGDQSWPIYWPRPQASALGWRPLALGTGWEGDTGPDGVPECRLMDGMIEVQGAVRRTDGEVPAAGAPHTVGTLPVGLAPVYRVLAAGATLTNAAQESQSVAAWGPGTAGTTSTSFTETLETAAALTVSFVAPSSQKVNVLFGANCTNSSATGIGYMSIGLRRGGTTVFSPSLLYATYRATDGFVSVSTSYPVSDLQAGVTYTVTAWYRSSSLANTAHFDKRFLRVDPVMPNPNMTPRTGLYQDGTLRVVYPHGSASSFVSFTGLRARAV
ncbi:phage baseplate assembly protein V [Streptomyces sp. NPDC056500]|uniref:phage baseplate assembly protein V n=1 Tax=Streptomyces sp. NPDC056500 TaxID=3345840 RepID=UPI0036B48F17